MKGGNALGELWATPANSGEREAPGSRWFPQLKLSCLRFDVGSRWERHEEAVAEDVLARAAAARAARTCRAILTFTAAPTAQFGEAPCTWCTSQSDTTAKASQIWHSVALGLTQLCCTPWPVNISIVCRWSISSSKMTILETVCVSIGRSFFSNPFDQT